MGEMSYQPGLPKIAQSQQLELHGPSDVSVTHEVAGYEDALELFCSFLCRSPGDREGMSNLLWFWDSLPIWSCEHLNRLPQDRLPNIQERRMAFEGQELEILITPGTIETRCSATGDAAGQRRYPGGVEMMVEHAVIKLASDRVFASEQAGRRTPVYSVSFSLRQIRKVLESLGSSVTHKRLREALDVLSTTSITIRDANAGRHGKRRTRREAILPGFARLENAGVNDQDQWQVNLHPIVAQGINNATYRQYRVDKLKRLAPYGVYMLRQMLLTCHTLSSYHPYRVPLSELREMSSGLNASRLADCIYRVEQELKKMADEGIIDSFNVEREFEKKRSKKGGRPRLTGAIFVLVPSSDTVSEVKAASVRQTHAEQTLQLARSRRGDRRRSAVDSFLSQEVTG